jgi:MFS family permease
VGDRETREEDDEIRRSPLLVPPSPLLPLLVLLAEGFLSRLSFGIISFALPLFAYRKLGLSLTETGLLFSLNLVAEQACKPMMGWVADRIGLKRALVAGIAVRSLVALLLVFAAAPWQVYAIRLLHGFSESLRDPAVSVLIAENARRERTASAFAWYTTAKMSAGSIGQALGAALLALMVGNYALVFAVAFFLSLLPLVAVARYLTEPARTAGVERAQLDADAATVKRHEGSLFSIAMLGFLSASTARMLGTLFPVLALEYAGLSAGQTSVIFMVSLIVVIAAGPAFGWLSDHVSQRLVLMVRGVANTVSSGLFWFFPNWWGMAIGNTLDAVGKAAFRPAWGALMAQVASYDRQRRARTMSYLSMGEGLGETIGPVLGGLLWHTWGVGALLAARVVLALIAEVYAVLLTHDIRQAARCSLARARRALTFGDAKK